MTDNPRYALYQAPYTVLPASRMGETRDFLCTVAGRCCESGDLIQEKVSLPQPARDDLLAVLTTGAYNFTMASNYNRLCRPALVMVRGGKAGWRSAGRPLRTWWPATCKGSARTGGKKAMEIRRAALADIPGVCACCVAAFKDYIPLIGQTPGPMLEDYCQARKEHFLFVAAQGEIILGYLLIKDGDGEVMWMDVLAAWPKGTGVGRRLMDHCEAFLRARGKTECRLYTHVKYQRTLEIYRQRGYVIYDRVQEKGFDRYYMRKQLK